MIKKWQIVTASMLLSLLSFKVQANVKFIVDNKPGELVFGYEALCVDKGYSVKASDCAEGMVGNSCPYSDEYVDKCLTPTEWCTANGYGKVASDCVKPEYPYEACPKDGTRFKSCLRDNGRACQEEDYYLVCNETGTIPDTSAAGCPYDTSYKKCVCNPCEGYTYTLAEATAQGYVAGPSCNSCGTVKYMRLPADCGSYVECDCGGIGTACWSGTKNSMPPASHAARIVAALPTATGKTAFCMSMRSARANIATSAAQWVMKIWIITGVTAL